MKALNGEIKDLEDKITKLAEEQQAADSLRDEEAAAYANEQTSFSSTIESIGKALQKLKDAKCDSAGLIELESSVKRAQMASSSALTHNESRVMQAFLQQPFDAREGSTHVMRCDPVRMKPVIELLKKLNSDFDTQKLESTKAENNKKNSHERNTLLNEKETKATSDLRDETVKARDEDETALLKRYSPIGLNAAPKLNLIGNPIGILHRSKGKKKM